MNRKPSYKELEKRIRELEEELIKGKQAEEGLRQREAKHLFLLEQTTDTIWALDMNMKPIYVSPASANVLGFTPEERLSQHLSDMVTPQTYARVIDILTRELAREQEENVNRNRTITIEMEYYHKDGHTVWLENRVRAIRGNDGQMTGIHGVSRDITERKRAEEALRESEELYTRLVDTIPDVIVRTDLEGKILFVNDYTLQISGYCRDELEGQNMLMFIAPEDRDRLVQNFLLMMEHRLGPQEYRMIMKGGRKIAFEVNGDVLRNEDGTPFGTVNVCRDITDRKQAEKERSRYEKLQSVLEMAGAICHELNQPMQIISGYSEMIMKHTSENDPLYKKLDTINKQIHRMGAITKNLMNIKDYETQDYAGFTRIIDLNKSSAKDME